MLNNEDSPVDRIMHACTDEKSALFGLKMAEKYKHFYTSVGFHPECMNKLPINYMEILSDLTENNPDIKAIGEIGLDYHYDGMTEKNK